MSGKLQGHLRAAMQQARRQALQESGSAAAPTSLPLAAVVLPATQPRQYFDDRAMAELTESVRQSGVLQPVLVRPLGEGAYELVAGERRYRAAQAAGLTELPVLVRALTDVEASQLALVENLQREDLNPIEETEGVLQLLGQRLGKGQEQVIGLLYRMHNERGGRVVPQDPGGGEEQQIKEVFSALGRLQWDSFVVTRLPLLNLPPEILAAVRHQRLAYTKARELARVADPLARQKLLERAVVEEMSLVEIRKAVAAINGGGESKGGAEEIGRRLTDVVRRIRQLPKVWRDRSLSGDRASEQMTALLQQIEVLLRAVEVGDLDSADADQQGVAGGARTAA